MKNIMRAVAVLTTVLGIMGQSSALVSEARPGIAYRDQVMFLDKKIVEAGDVQWVTLAYKDPSVSRDCSNLIDVLSGRKLFADIPEKSWVLIDYKLRSLVIQAGFAGDGDVGRVVLCPDEKACRMVQKQRASSRQIQNPPWEQGRILPLTA